MENLANETVQTIQAYNHKAEILWRRVYNVREIIKDIFPTTIDKDSNGEYTAYQFQSDDMYKRKLLAEGLKTDMYSIYRELEKLEVEHRKIALSLKDD